MATTKETALVTGASSGIGLELARGLAEHGMDLVLVARSEGRLKELAQELERKHGVAVSVIPLDLGRPDAPDQLFARLKADGRSVDVLVNNAGFGVNGAFVSTDTRRELEMVQLNVAALTHLTKLFVTGMVERGRGRILNVASTAAYVPGPLMAVYYATKAYVLSFSEALAAELAGTGVTCTVLCPGATDTGFQSTANSKDSRLFRSGVMKADHVARVALAGMLKGKTHVIPGARNKVVVQSTRFAPRAVLARIAKALNSSPPG